MPALRFGMVRLDGFAELSVSSASDWLSIWCPYVVSPYPICVLHLVPPGNAGWGLREGDFPSENKTILLRRPFVKVWKETLTGR